MDLDARTAFPGFHVALCGVFIELPKGLPVSLCGVPTCSEVILDFLFSLASHFQSIHHQPCQLFVPSIFLFLFFFFLFLGPHAYGGSQARGPVGAVATSLQHSHSNAGSEPCLQPTAQLSATLDPSSVDGGQGSNPHPHGY